MEKNKIKIGVIFIFTLLLISCSSNDLKIDQLILNKAEEKAIIDLITTNLSISKKAKIIIESTELQKIDGSYYLISFHGKERTATLLRVEGETTLKYAGISCTSKSCPTSDSCVPDKDGEKCSACPRGSDCTKTVTSDELTQ